MGASSSTSQLQQEEEVESLAASTGALPMLRASFSRLSDPSTNCIPLQALKDLFCINFTNIASKASSVPECFPKLVAHMGPTVVDLFFITGKGGVCWSEFVRGYVRCCGQMPLSVSIKNLCRLYAAGCAKAGNSLQLEFESDDPEGKMSGFLLPSDIVMLLWMCWVMLQSSRKLCKESVKLILPDINHLVFSVIAACNEKTNDFDVKDSNLSTLEYQISVQTIHYWISSTVPGLAHCFSQYINDRLQGRATSEEVLYDSSCSEDENLPQEWDKYLLTCGRAWAIYLSMRDTRNELLNICFSGNGMETHENLLYRSSVHGKGLNRFWSCIEGYYGELLMLVSATSADAHKGNDAKVERWVIGVLTHQGFESKDTFYGDSASLYSISPIFHPFPPKGLEKNFIYSHLHPTGKLYQAHPKPVGIAFGGTAGNERIFIDEDFARVTVRHHAVDKTYQPGSLIPNQGFLPTEASIIEVEVWGLGGKTVKEQQDAYKKREQIFTEQRRKVDLKTFATWEDSPEKMMMDMMGDPNRVRREDR